MEGTINAVQTDPRTNYLINMSKIQQLDNDYERFDAAIEHASRSLQSNSKGEEDGAAYLIAAQTLADHAQKDMNWKKALASEHRKPALEALDKELNSLQKTILTEIFAQDPSYEAAVLNATPGRLLLDIKRSGKYKVCGVKQGFRENTEVTDGPDFNYYSSVVRLFTVRIALCSRRSRDHIIAIKDVSTAFLQSEGYPEGQRKLQAPTYQQVALLLAIRTNLRRSECTSTMGKHHRTLDREARLRSWRK